MIKVKINKTLKEKEKFIGGAADNMPDSDFDPNLLKKGKEKEMHDHGLNAAEADEIAKDELVLDPEGYASELKESIPDKQLNFYVLIGPPAVGKSTWVKENFEDTGKDYAVIGKDVFIEKGISKIYGFTAAELYVKNPTPEQKQALEELNHMFESAFASILDHRVPNVIVDMMNVDPRMRKLVIDKVKDRYPEYKIIGVKFEFEGHEEDVMKADAERAKARRGERTAIGRDYIANAIKKFRENPPSKEEGFDEIISYNRFKEPEQMNEYNHRQFIDWLSGEMQNEEEENRLLIESKLSKYWKIRAARRAKNAERNWPNKVDREWALKEQEKSLTINNTVHEYFEKELDQSEQMVGEIDDVLKSIKKTNKIKKETKLEHPATATKRRKNNKSISVPTHPEYGGVAKGYKKKSKKMGGATLAPGEAFGPMEEEKA